MADELKQGKGLIAQIAEANAFPIKASYGDDEIRKVLQDFMDVIKKAPPRKYKNYISGAMMLAAPDDWFIAICNDESIEVQCGLDIWKKIKERMEKLGLLKNNKHEE